MERSRRHKKINIFFMFGLLWNEDGADGKRAACFGRA
jgi:hypothetical protein